MTRICVALNLTVNRSDEASVVSGILSEGKRFEQSDTSFLPRLCTIKWEPEVNPNLSNEDKILCTVFSVSGQITA